MIIRILAVIVAAQFLYLGTCDDGTNCHGYAWDGNGWLEDVRPRLTRPGNDVIVYYRNGHPIHSALNLGNGWVRSKWGACGVFTHPVWFSPYGNSTKIFDKPRLRGNT